jgi:hypothetical protein
VLGKGGEEQRTTNLSTILDGYFAKGGRRLAA